MQRVFAEARNRVPRAAGGRIHCIAQVYLTADGVTPAYTRIKGVLYSSPENPDCAHPIVGPHITQVPDSDLGSYAFDFNLHVIPDNDRYFFASSEAVPFQSR